MWVKAVIIILLIAIVATVLATAGFVVKDGSDKRRVLSALKLRWALSVVLVLFVLFSYWMGWIAPHPAVPPAPP